MSDVVRRVRARLSRQLVPGGRRTKPAMPHGFWDEVSASALAAQPGMMLVSGWAMPGRGTSPVRIHVLRDSVVIAETATGHDRPDVADLHGPAALRSGWRVHVPVDAADHGARFEVVADDGVGSTSLGRHRLRLERPTGFDRLATTGSVDLPAAGATVEGGMLRIEGWAMVGGLPADIVEVHLDGHFAGRARRCIPRPDVGLARRAVDNVSTSSGFWALLPFPDVADPSRCVIQVRAIGEDGTIWQPDAITVHRVRVVPDSYLVPLPGASAVEVFHSRRGERAHGRAGARPRVCVITHSLALGGGELYLQELLLRMVTDGVADFAVIAPEDGPLRVELERAGVPVHLTNGFPVDPPTYLGRQVEIGALIESWGADVVLANTAGVFPAVDAAHAIGVPVIWAIHESYELDLFTYLVYGPAGHHPEVERRWREAFERCQVVVFESEATRRLYQRELPAMNSRCVRYGIDTDAVRRYQAQHERDALRAELGFEPEHRVLMSMGVFQERKGQLALVQAFAPFVESHPDARLVLVGFHPSHYGQAVRTQVEELGIESHVRLIDIGPDTYRWYHVCDVLVSASDTESLPRSVLEAMTFGRPTLAVDVFGLSEVVRDGINGWLCEDRSGVSMMAGLRRVLSTQTDELARMAQACLADARSFDGSGYATTYARMITDIHASRKRL